MEERRGHDVRLEDVAKAAGVSRQAVYLHFGSRTELMIATARYLDQVLRCDDRLRPVLTSQDGVRSLEAYVEFWGNYIPEIYGLAKALMAARETDEAAAAAWNDRMGALYQGCLQIVRCLQQQNKLAPEWSIEEAASFFRATLAIETWDTLTEERGWSKDQYIERIQRALKRVLVRGA